MDSVFRDVTYQYNSKTNKAQSKLKEISPAENIFKETASNRENESKNNLKSGLNIFNLKTSNDSLGKKGLKNELLLLDENKENAHPNKSNKQINYDLSENLNKSESKLNSTIPTPNSSMSSFKSESDDSKLGQEVSSPAKNNANILNRISLAEKSLNNFCNEVEQCQISMKNF